MTNELVLITPKNQINSFISAVDRAYFSNPIRVNFVRKDADGFAWVTDPARGHTYPVNPQKLKREYQLTNRQRAALT